MDRDLNEMLETHSSTVQENLGEKEGVKVKIFVEPTERPRHFRARPVAYAPREKNENEYGSTCPWRNYKINRILKVGHLHRPHC